jgi:hypothetical protein
MEQTAVEWLGKKLESYGAPEFCEIEWEKLDILIQQAKEMEKQQIIEAIAESNKSNNRNVSLNPEQYYNETFKKK